MARIKEKLKSYEKYERLLIGNFGDEAEILKDEEFITLWKENMGTKFSYELNHIHKVLTKGGYYCNTPKGRFINTIGMKNIWSHKFKTVIFDATALIDQDYSDENLLKFVDIPNPRKFPKLTFNFYMEHSLTKGRFRNSNYLHKACADFTSSLKKFKETYVITHKDYSYKIFKEMSLNDTINIMPVTSEKKIRNFGKVNVLTQDDSKLFYHGNTKGNNSMKEATQMVMLRYNILPDYAYITQYLCTKFDAETHDKVYQGCKDIKVAEKFTERLEIKKENDGVYLYQKYCMLTDFIQEVYRTKLRQYDCDDEISIYCFQTSLIFISMIKQMFPECKINTIRKKLECFADSKGENRKNKGEAYTKWDEWRQKQLKGRTFKVEEFLKEAELTNEQLKGLKKTNAHVREWFKSRKGTKNGYYVA